MNALLLSLLVTLPSFAGDKVGNGGGLWACSPNGEVQASVLVDFYELENETRWRLFRPSRADAFGIVDEVMDRARAAFPDYASRWAAVMQETKSRIIFTNSELKEIDDSLWRVKPLDSLCRSGWKYLQFANYNDTLKKVLIRKDLWDSGAVSPFDKAGLVWHEAVYRWMREQYGDKDSVRARQITGILFADLPVAEARRALEDVLKQGPNDPVPGKPVFVCLVPNPHTSRWFYEYGDNELAARNSSIRKCKLADEGNAFFCEARNVGCESFTSLEQKFTCAVDNRHMNKTFTETGRSRLEAEAKARAACGEAEGAFFCEKDVTCQ